MFLPMSGAGSREDPCHPLGNSASQLPPDQGVPDAGAASVLSDSGGTGAGQQLVPDPAAKTNPAEPALSACGFLCSKFLSIISVAHYQLVQGKVEAKQTAIPKMPVIL